MGLVKNQKFIRVRNILPFIMLILLGLPAVVRSLAITSARLIIEADDCFAAYIDGNLVYNTGMITSGEPWNRVYDLDVKGLLTKCGQHVLAVNYYDTMSNGVGLTYKLQIDMDNGNSVVAYSDGNSRMRQILNGNAVLGTQTFPPGWNTLGYDDSAWTGAVYTCQAYGDTFNSIADPVFAGSPYNGWVPQLSFAAMCKVSTPGDSSLIRQTFSVPCAPVSITKTISDTTVYLGQTITYCFNYHNYDVASATFDLWDTIPAVTDFVGCDNSCTLQTFGSNVVVKWTITVPSNASGTVCMWVAANRYPYNGPAGGIFAMITGIVEPFQRRNCGIVRQ